jgi:hypothetical protein
LCFHHFFYFVYQKLHFLAFFGILNFSEKLFYAPFQTHKKHFKNIQIQIFPSKNPRLTNRLVQSPFNDQKFKEATKIRVWFARNFRPYEQTESPVYSKRGPIWMLFALLRLFICLLYSKKLRGSGISRDLLDPVSLQKQRCEFNVEIVWSACEFEKKEWL